MRLFKRQKKNKYRVILREPVRNNWYWVVELDKVKIASGWETTRALAVEAADRFVRESK